MCLMKLENMSEFNFKSQVCTDLLQSERLLALGLKKETADIVHFFSRSLAQDWTIVPLAENETARQIQDNEIPAWSLHRLIEMLANSGYYYGGLAPIEYNNAFDGLIDDIEKTIKEGYFNKEYLV